MIENFSFNLATYLSEKKLEIQLFFILSSSAYNQIYKRTFHLSPQPLVSNSLSVSPNSSLYIANLSAVYNAIVFFVRLLFLWVLVFRSLLFSSSSSSSSPSHCSVYVIHLREILFEHPRVRTMFGGNGSIFSFPKILESLRWESVNSVGSIDARAESGAKYCATSSWFLATNSSQSKSLELVSIDPMRDK